jgi:hypothetical protein
MTTLPAYATDEVVETVARAICAEQHPGHNLDAIDPEDGVTPLWATYKGEARAAILALAPAVEAAIADRAERRFADGVAFGARAPSRW